MQLRDLDTPALVVDLDRVEANISRYQHYLDAHAIAGRPHIKTHKIPLFCPLAACGGCGWHYMPEDR